MFNVILHTEGKFIYNLKTLNNGSQMFMYSPLT